MLSEEEDELDEEEEEPDDEEELPESVVRGVEFLSSLDNRGDILVFLPGEREIRDCAERLENCRFDEDGEEVPF